MGMFDKFKGKVNCPHCNYEVKVYEQTKNYECMLKDFKVGDYIDKGNANYFYELTAHCDVCNKDFPVFAAIRRGQLVSYMTDITDVDIMSLENIEDGYERNREYEKMYEEQIGIDHSFKFNENHLHVGDKITYFKTEWIIDSVYTEKVKITENDVLNNFLNDTYKRNYVYYVHNTQKTKKRVIKVTEPIWSEMYLEYKNDPRYVLKNIE